MGIGAVKAVFLDRDGVLNEATVRDMLSKLSLLENRLEKAALKLSADL